LAGRGGGIVRFRVRSGSVPDERRSMQKRIVFLAFALWLSLCCAAQTLTGTVTDAKTGEVLPLANVSYGGADATQTGLDGSYRMAYRPRKLTFSMLGYKSQTLRPKAAGRLDVQLEQVDYTDIGEAVVTARKGKYSRKNNPAVELMRKVIAAKARSDLKQHDYYSFDRYRRTTFAFNEVTEKVLQEGHFKRLPFLKDYVETCNETGKLILPISVDELVTQEVFRRSPRSEKSLVKGRRSDGLNTLFATGGILTTVLQDCFTDVNIYDDNVRLLQYPFTSPVSKSSAIAFYRYFLTDTLVVDGVRAIKVDFTPNNAQDFGFSGSLYVAADSTYRLVRIDMGLPARSEVNYVEDMRIIQKFKQLPTGEQVLVSDNMLVQLKLLDFLQKFQVKRVTEYSRFSFEELPPQTFDFRGPERDLPEAAARDEAFWSLYRGEPLSKSEAQMGDFVSKLTRLKGFKPLLWLAKAFIENYVETSTRPDRPSKVDFGPVNTTLSQNFVDGFRLRASAQTTAALHPRLFLRSYVAYGFKDHKVKGLGEVTWSFNKRKNLPREFPVHNLTLTYNRDVMSPSDKFLPTDKDNVFTSFKWTTVDHMMYYENFRLLYDREWENNLRLKIQLRREKDRPTAALFYQPLDGRGAPSQDPALWRRSLITSDATFSLEYLPGTSWVDTKQRRLKANNDAPVYGFSHTVGVKGLFGADYHYNFTELTLGRRFWLGRSWGRIDLMMKGGIQWNRVPYPLLIMPAANLSYIMEDNTFSLIDNMEFLNDRYVSLMASWDLNGKIFNRIPLLKKLKWREFIGCNVLWGTLTDKNNPLLPQNAADSRLFYFPGHFERDGSFTALSRPMDRQVPYVEVVVGIHNIFKLFHLEYVRRLTYLQGLPASHKWGIRGAFNVSF